MNLFARSIFGAFVSVLIASHSLAAGWAEGVPVSIQKSDYSNLNLNLIYIKLDSPVSVANNCTSSLGVVVLDSHDSSDAALSLAMTALAAGKKFSCYVTDQCSRITGAVTTYPICANYPTLKN